MDYSLPAESHALPVDGKIKVVRVTETVTMSEESIPFGSRTELSAALALVNG